ncbi:MAG: hypothetical protein V3S10_05735 [Dehalococcoidales bacterium]
MIERVHEHIVSELKQNTWTDIIFVIVVFWLNGVALGANSIVATVGDAMTQTIIMVIFTVLIIVVNFVAILGLQRGKQTRQKLIEGLLKMYRDQSVDGYYDESLLGNYETRYNLFILVVIITGIVAIVVPYVVRAAV